MGSGAVLWPDSGGRVSTVFLGPFGGGTTEGLALEMMAGDEADTMEDGTSRTAALVPLVESGVAATGGAADDTAAGAGDTVEAGAAEDSTGDVNSVGAVAEALEVALQKARLTG